MNLRTAYSVISIAALFIAAYVTGGIDLNPKGGHISVFRTLTYTDQLRTIRDLAEKDAPSAWNFLRDVALVDGEALLEAHAMAHLIGGKIYAQKGFFGITICTNDFAYGCMHGVMERFFAEKGESSIRDVEARCRELFMSHGEPVYQGMSGCIHGSGHGLLSYFAYDIPSALTVCSEFSSDIKNYCYDGVFMEAAQGVPSGQITVPTKAWDFCVTIPEDALYECSKYLPMAFALSKFPDAQMKSNVRSDFTLFLNLCTQAPRKDQRQWCTEAVGHMLAVQEYSSPRHIIEKCSAVASERDECLVSAATGMAFKGYVHWRTTVEELCGAILSAEQRATCIKNAETQALREGRM